MNDLQLTFLNEILQWFNEILKATKIKLLDNDKNIIHQIKASQKIYAKLKLSNKKPVAYAITKEINKQQKEKNDDFNHDIL